MTVQMLPITEPGASVSAGGGRTQELQDHVAVSRESAEGKQAAGTEFTMDLAPAQGLTEPHLIKSSWR